MWRAGAKLAALTLGGAGAAAIATSDGPSSTFKICTIVPLRLLRDSITVATMAFDYQYSLWGLKEESIEWLRAKHEVHGRCAYRLQELCFRNGGIYIKLGQHIGQLEYVVPQEYVQTMRASMLKRCPVSSYDQVHNVFVKELGEPPEKIFAEFDPVPLASASLAQVHAARTHDGRKVAVKVQHTHLTDTAIADIATVDLIVNFLHWFFPAFDYRWLVDEIRESAPKELDFLFEARNSEKCLDNFRRLSPQMADSIYAPKVYWNLSTSRLLTMEFMDAAEITDVSAIQRLGIEPNDVSKLVSQAFAEMTFKHGFVHCDPHAANMMVRPLPSSKWNCFVPRIEVQWDKMHVAHLDSFHIESRMQDILMTLIWFCKGFPAHPAVVLPWKQQDHRRDTHGIWCPVKAKTFSPFSKLKWDEVPHLTCLMRPWASV